MLFIFVASISSCNKEEIDDEKPQIDYSYSEFFPSNCDTLLFGETFTLKLLLKDNMELGSLSIDIHHNFDHHNHSTEVIECSLDPIKTPVNPLVLSQDFSIPEGQTEYVFSQDIFLPASDANGDYDTGDYHFFISLTDKSGWSDQMGLSIKIVRP